MCMHCTTCCSSLSHSHSYRNGVFFFTPGNRSWLAQTPQASFGLYSLWAVKPKVVSNNTSRGVVWPVTPKHTVESHFRLEIVTFAFTMGGIHLLAELASKALSICCNFFQASPEVPMNPESWEPTYDCKALLCHSTRTSPLHSCSKVI